MSLRPVTSPGGDEIVVYDDAEFAARLGLVEYPSTRYSQLVQRTDMRMAILKALWNHGPFHDPSGMISSQLMAEARRYTTVWPDARSSALLKAPAVEACLERNIRGKRTFDLRLAALPERWLQALEKSPHPLLAEDDIPTTVTLPEAPPEIVVELTEAPAVEQPPAPSEIVNSVATALLAQVAEIITKGNLTAPEMSRLEDDIAALQERLGSQIEYGERLRRDLRDAGEEISALKYERDGLRKRLQTAEHNLQVATSADTQRIIDEEVHRQIERLMRQPPRPNGARVDVEVR